MLNLSNCSALYIPLERLFARHPEQPVFRPQWNVIVVVQATFVHANVRWEFPAIRSFVVTPCYHYLHHAAERPAADG